MLIAYKSVTQINQLSSYISVLIAGGLTLRYIIIFFNCIGEELTFKEAFISCKKRFIGAVVAITLSALVTYFASFYKTV